MEITSGILNEILYEFMILSALLLVGVFLRAKIKLFQNLFLPASVIAGFIGLLISPMVLGGASPIPETMMTGFNAYPGILIVPIIAAAPLGMQFPKKKEFVESVGPHMIVSASAIFFQFAACAAAGAVCLMMVPSLYPTFGLEAFAGFWGGHSTAGLLANRLTELGQGAIAADAQGVGITMATFGILSGVIFGTVMINIGARKKYTAVLTKPGDIPFEIKRGYVNDVNKQQSIGRAAILAESSDVVAFHYALILAVTAIAYLIYNPIKANNVPFLADLSVWLWALLIMLIVWYVMVKAGLDWLVDRKIVNHCTSTLMEFAVVSAIMSLPIQTVMNYIVPILFVTVITIIATVAITVWPIGVRFLPSPWLERGVASFGQCCGVFMTGALLLRIADPDNETPCLSSYSFSFALASLVGWPYFAFAPAFTLKYGLWAFAGLSLVLTIAVLLIAKMIGWYYGGPRTFDPAPREISIKS